MAGRITAPSTFCHLSHWRNSDRKSSFRCRRHRRCHLASKAIGQTFFLVRFLRRTAFPLEAGRPPRATGPPAMRYEVKLSSSTSGEKKRVVELERHASGWRVKLDGQPVAVDAVEIAPNTLSILLDGQSFEIAVTPSPDGKLRLHAGTQEFIAEIIDPRTWSGRRHGKVDAD